MAPGRRSLQIRLFPSLSAAIDTAHRWTALTSTTLPSQLSLQRHPNSSHARRRIVTSSIAPPITATERPETIVLAESKLYASSWHDSFASSFPGRGLHFSSVDITTSSTSTNFSNQDNDHRDGLTLSALESNLGNDLSNLHGQQNSPSSTSSSSAHVLLVAKGPIPCLVSQYFLESLPLAGLVLVDPLLLPEDGRRIGSDKNKNNDAIANNTDRKKIERWNRSLTDLIAMLEGRPPSLMNASLNSDGQDAMTTQEKIMKDLLNHPEINLLYSLATQTNNPAIEAPRPLRLEPGSIPILVFYSKHSRYSDYYRICGERTAAFHTACGGKFGDYFDQVSVLGIPKKKKETDVLDIKGTVFRHVGGDDGINYNLDGCDDGIEDDVDWVVNRIYEWYDEVVA